MSVSTLVKRRSFRFTTATLPVLAALLIPFLNVDTSEGQGSATALAFDIAENGLKFVFDETPVHRPDGLPDYGGEFTTQGYIYPAGTLKVRDAFTTGVNSDGSAQFPEKVIGTWTCYGTHLGEGAHTKTGPWVATTQIFDLGPKAGDMTIVTSGVELVDLNVAVRRAVIGSTGLPNMDDAEQVQSMVGFNDSNGVTLRVRFDK